MPLYCAHFYACAVKKNSNFFFFHLSTPCVSLLFSCWSTRPFCFSAFSNFLLIPSLLPFSRDEQSRIPDAHRNSFFTCLALYSFYNLPFQQLDLALPSTATHRQTRTNNRRTVSTIQIAQGHNETHTGRQRDVRPSFPLSVYPCEWSFLS